HFYARRRTGRSFDVRALGAFPAHDLRAGHIGPGSISQHGSLRACAGLAGTPGQKADPSVPAHGHHRNAARLLCKPRALYRGDSWAGAFAVEPGESSDAGLTRLPAVALAS